MVLLGLAALFLLCRVFPLRKKKIVLLRRFPEWGSLGALGDAIEADKCLQGYRVLRVEDWRRLSTIYHLATAGIIFINDGFTPLRYFALSKKIKLVQIWHADGALKRWGASVNPEGFPEMRRCTAAVCCGEAVRPGWSEALGLPMDRILALGSPRMDALARPCDAQALRRAFNMKYPQCEGKRLILYAPSFRGGDTSSVDMLSHFDFAKFRQRFGDELALLVRLHPKMHGQYNLPDWVIDLTGEPGHADLLRVSERFITDYSSLMLDAAALGLPVILYTYDYDDYMANDQGFYTGLRELPPGPIVTDFDALLDLLAKPDGSAQLRENFAAFHLGKMDGKSCERIVNTFILGENK